MPVDKPPSRADHPPRLTRPATRAVVLEDIARAFLSGANHDPHAAATFAEIGAALIPRVDLSTAVAVARMLAGRDDAPPAVLNALAARGLKPKGASAPKRSADATQTAPTASPENEPTPQPSGNDIPLVDDGARSAPDGRAVLDSAIADAVRHAALDSGPELRRRLDSVANLALARAAERGDRDDAILILARVLALPAHALSPLFDEASGELLAIACRAAGLERNDAVRVLAGVGPTAARTSAGLREAIASFRRLDRAAAVRLLATIMGREWAARGDGDVRDGAVRDQSEARRTAATAATVSPSFTALTEQASPTSTKPASTSRAASRGQG